MSVSQLQLLEDTWESEIKKGNSFFQSSAFDQAFSNPTRLINA